MEVQSILHKWGMNREPDLLSAHHRCQTVSPQQFHFSTAVSIYCSFLFCLLCPERGKHDWGGGTRFAILRGLRRTSTRMDPSRSQNLSMPTTGSREVYRRRLTSDSRIVGLLLGLPAIYLRDLPEVLGSPETLLRVW